jgi:uncharacterized protein YbjT (DUF2867 family)
MFLMGSSYEAGTDEETRQGIIAADAAKATGVGHLLYSSVRRQQEDRHPAFRKQVSRRAGCRRARHPLYDQRSSRLHGEYRRAVVAGCAEPGHASFRDASQTRPPTGSPGDIGAFVAALVERREQVFGKRFDFAADELSGEEQAKILSQAIGRPITYQEIPIAVARQQSADAALMFEWFDRVGYDADIAALQRDFPEVSWHSFAAWAREFDWSTVEPPSSAA